MKNPQLQISTFMMVLFLGACTYANIVDFESQTPGTTYGNPAGHISGDVIFTENGIPVSVHNFDWGGGGGTFNLCRIELAFPGFGNCQVMQTNNINLMFDFDAPGFPVNYVTFEFADLGGFENISVNGMPIMVGELTAAPAIIAPGVMLSMVTVPIGGGQKGFVTLKGEIHKLLVGGQEFFLDNIRAFFFPMHCVTFESLTPGSSYGSPGNAPGDVILAENNIPVSVHDFHFVGGGGTFNFCKVDPAFSGFGVGQIMQTNNINLGFDFRHLGYVTNYVTFEFADLGGFENISVNGHPVYTGELTAAPVLIAPCITLHVVPMPMPGGIKGIGTLTGPIKSFFVGGQEFWLDNICAMHSPRSCVDFESLVPGTVFGNPAGHSPGDFVFAENGIPVSVHDFNFIGGGGTFNFCEVGLATPDFGHCQVMMVNNINLKFDFDCLGFIPYLVTFTFADHGGFENISVNGEPIFAGELTAAPPHIAPGVTMDVKMTGAMTGKVTLKGEVGSLLIGGQEFKIDNICAKDSVVNSVDNKDKSGHSLPQTLVLGKNFPNPFNPETTIRIEVPSTWRSAITIQIFNPQGRLLQTLVHGTLSAGFHDITWTGTDDQGERVASGVYYYRLSSGDFTAIGKMLLLK